MAKHKGDPFLEFRREFLIFSGKYNKFRFTLYKKRKIFGIWLGWEYLGIFLTYDKAFDEMMANIRAKSWDDKFYFNYEGKQVGEKLIQNA